MASKVVPISDRITGAAMDQPLPKKQRILIVVGACILLPVLMAAAFWDLVPRGLSVPEMELRIATAQRGLFRNDLVTRASAAPLHSVMLDAFQSGRVEEVLAIDGAHVAKGDLLFWLSNPSCGWSSWRASRIARSRSRIFRCCAWPSKRARPTTSDVCWI